MWWDTTKIEATVTRQFVCSHLLPQEIQRLDQQLGFGDGLTDGTYWEWIEQKAKRIFLILLELGIPDQIFGVVDDSWDDDDLPIPLDQVERLALTARPDEKVDRRFYQRQFHFLVRYLEQGDHLDLADVELPPLDVVDKKTGIVQTAVDKIQLGNKPGVTFMRRRFPLALGPGQIPRDQFLAELKSLKRIQTTHVLAYYASYTHQGYGYIILSPAWESNLKSILVALPPPLKALEKQIRRELILNWIHCLADSLCYIHSRGRSLGNIKPSALFVGKDHDIFFTESRFGVDLASQTTGSNFDKEAYDYAAPEQWYRPSRNSSFETHQHRKMSSASPPGNTTFAISRSYPDPPPPAAHKPVPQLDPQAADVFSLGCIILEILGLLLKRQSKNFAAHRAAKHKMAGRGGAVPDSSFHQNIGQVESWMTSLAKDAEKKDAKPMQGITPMLQVVARMLSLAPQDRPTAQDVERSIYQILTRDCEITEPHCVHEYGGLARGIGSLRLGLAEAKEDQPSCRDWRAVGAADKLSLCKSPRGIYYGKTS
ncbi:kinase-like domain-containing protein [Microdochium trichocladiopsis]|uniref:Kinase-like domain-containing protein n=1 Tax=Microdochium trichocladiopsis TaxID=1682393 RepID=A0A9P8YIV2_9PEZI|nr:kinase-like domain-containing protein [Microdochium trichocladiopsis]KAH7040156.1 kinase-like domain-containing protein [Microdochium trichocladiopsis]